jgi:23S rRNA pseudouridine2457 synthase
MSDLVLFNKPYNVLSQFTDTNSAEQLSQTLATYIDLPNVYPAGRLDKDSEGLLLLTNDGQLQHHIANPKMKMPKSYWVQIEGQISPEALAQLHTGVKLNDGMSKPAIAEIISEPDIWPRIPPIRERKNIPTSWINLTIREGRNRQVRRMTAATGFPTLRLIRHQIGEWQLNDLLPGDYRLLKV